MNKNITYAIIFLVVGVIVGYMLGSSMSADSHTVETKDDHEHAHSLPHDHSHAEHGAVEVAEYENIPAVELAVLTDPKAGWNLQITTPNFAFSPQQASLEHVAGEGHAHLFIDDVKVTRLYSEWFHIPELTPGEHEIKVTLNTNDHNDYTLNGEIISARQTIMVE